MFPEGGSYKETGEEEGKEIYAKLGVTPATRRDI